MPTIVRHAVREAIERADARARRIVARAREARVRLNFVAPQAERHAPAREAELVAEIEARVLRIRGRRIGEVGVHDRIGRHAPVSGLEDVDPVPVAENGIRAARGRVVTERVGISRIVLGRDVLILCAEQHLVRDPARDDVGARAICVPVSRYTPMSR